VRRLANRSIKYLSDLNMRPPTAPRCGNLAGIELAGNRIVAGMTGRLHLPNERQDALAAN
jgi:hypothetical protein